MKLPFVFLSRGNYDTLQRKSDEACADVEKFRSRTKEMQEEIDSLLAENRKFLNRAKAAESESDENEDAAADAKKLIKQLRAENERLASELKESRAACEGYKVEIDNRAKAAESESDENEDAAADSKKLIGQLRVENERLASELKESRSACEGFKVENDGLQSKLTESEQKITKLKKENDDLEDEIDEVNEDLKKVKKEKQEAEQQKEEVEHDLKKAGEENEKLARAKAQVEEDCDGKSKSLDFVGEILDAAETADDDIRRTESSVDALVDFIRHDLPSAYKEAGMDFDVPSDPNNPQSDVALTRWATRAKKTWLKGKKSIAFVGEFSAGKTSIVNRILGQEGLLAVSAEATTAIPTYIMGGESQRFSFVSPDDKMKSLSDTTFRKVSKQVLANVKGVPKLLKYFVMTANQRALEGLSILDTPGFSSNDAEDAERTIGVINECDALYWVFDVNNGTVNRRSLKLIKENLHRPLFVVINKCDTKSKSEIDKVENLIRQTLHDEGVVVRQFLRFGNNVDPEVIFNSLRYVEKEGDDSAIWGHLYDLGYDIGWNEGRLILNADCEKQETERVDNWLGAFKSEFDEMAQRCDDVVNYVGSHWTENFFSSDKYELSAEEGKNLCDYVKSLAADIQKESKDVEDFKKVVENATEATKAFQENNSLLKVLRAAQKSFLQKIDAYDPGFKQNCKEGINGMVKDGRKAWDDHMKEIEQNNG
ncbi:MAG: dynamin family protein [Marinilabiliaceae bacterium]